MTDTERLDWLEREIMRVDPDSYASITQEFTFYFEQNYYRISEDNAGSIGKGVTLRDAIDSAMEEG